MTTKWCWVAVWMGASLSSTVAFAAPQAAAKKEGSVVAVVGADIHTVTREVVRRGTILIENGKITAVGQDVTVPPGAKVIDATGKQITPGFVAISMSGIGVGQPPSDAREKLGDALDPFDRNIKLSLAVGITAGCVELSSGGRGGFRPGQPEERFLGIDPESPPVDADEVPEFGLADTAVCPCCGLPVLPMEPEPESQPARANERKFAVLKMSYGRLDPMLVKESPFYAPSSRSLNGALSRHQWRDTIGKAKKYLEEQAAHEKAVAAGNRTTPPRKPVSDEVLRLVKKEIPLRTDADRVSDIRDQLALARELDYRIVLDGVTEGWLVADELGQSGAQVVMTPRQRVQPRRGEEDSSGSSAEAPGIFQRAGVPFAVAALGSSVSMMGIAGRDLTSLPLEAAFAVRGGCDEKTALAALTIVPARMLGIDERTGSIEVGKDADLLILDGPPLDYRTYVETALVSGHVVYERAKDRVLPD